MASPDSKKVIAGKPVTTGGVLVGPTTTTAPTNASTALNAGFVALGYLGEDGLTETADRSTTKVPAWGGDIVKTLQTDFATTFTFTLLEATNTDVLTTLYGTANVTTTAATTTTGTLNAVKVTSDTIARKSFVFEVKDGNARVRIYVPQGQVTAVDSVTYSDSEVVAFAVTVEAYRDSTLGANYVKYIDDAISSTGAIL